MSLIDTLRRIFVAAVPCMLDGTAAGGPRNRIRVAIISEGVNTWPLYVAQGKQFFEREGLAVEATLTGSSVKQLEELTSGGFDIGFQQSDHVVRAVEGGADLFIFMALAHAPGLTLVAARDVGSIEDLRGKMIAVDGARTGYALLLRRLLQERVVGDGDCTYQEFGGSQERFDALVAGRASASLLNPPFDKNLIGRGFRSLGTINEYFPDYPGTIGAARRSWASRHASDLVSFVRAFNAAYEWLRRPENGEEALRLLPERLQVDGQSARRALAAIARREPPAITAEGLRRVIDVVWDAEGYAEPKGVPEKYIDLGYARQAAEPA